MTTVVLEAAIQYLTFKIDGETFAVDIGKVREVLDFMHPTKVPNTPEFMRGVINVRGNGIPVVDLRIKFGLNKTEMTVNTCIIIMEVLVDGEQIVVGALADSVQEVVALESGQIGPAPKIGTKLKTEFISGMGKQNEKFIMLLDIDKILSSNEIPAVQESR